MKSKLTLAVIAFFYFITPLQFAKIQSWVRYVPDTIQTNAIELLNNIQKL
jgi:hypothetical protein